jgi:hypothetical protein
MEDEFRAWWQESYGWHVGTHAVMTHVAWGEHLLATRPSLALPDDELIGKWSEKASNGGNATLAEVEQRIVEMAIEWAWRQRG